MAKQMESVSETDRELEAIKQHIDGLRTELSMLTKHIKGLSSATLERAQSAGALKIEELGADLERAAEALRKQGQQSLTQIEQTIREKPLLSLLAAFGAGMLIARLLERR